MSCQYETAIYCHAGFPAVVVVKGQNTNTLLPDADWHGHIGVMSLISNVWLPEFFKPLKVTR